MPQQRVDADVHSAKACARKRFGVPGQQDTIGREGEVGYAARGEHLDEDMKLAARQWLAAGEADRVDAEAHEDAHEPVDLLVGQDLRARQPLHPFGRHAVRAAEVAAVGHRDPEVVGDAAEGIDERHRN